MRNRCDPGCLEWRRLRALHLKQMSWKQKDIATALDVTPGAVSQWLAASRTHGTKALHSRLAHGRPAKLTPDQKQLIPDFLWHGAEAYGFSGELWICARVGKVLEQEFGIVYSKSQVSRLLKEMKWTPQVPITRAIQRDEKMIENWRVQIWPELKKRAFSEGRTLVFIDESGFYLLPGTVKTYAPKGETPVLHNWHSREHLSVMAAITLQGKVFTLVRRAPLNGLHTVEFLGHLLHMAGRLLVVLDRSPIHRNAALKEFALETGMIHLELLPPYAPDLNPVEWMWRHFKQIEMANLTCMNLDELQTEFNLALRRLRGKAYLLKSFFSEAGLNL